MKRFLWVIRHAKSSWEDSHIPDINRPLNWRGQRDAPFMAKRSAESGLSVPTVMWVSPAKRTVLTANWFKFLWEIPPGAFIQENALYMADAYDLLRLLKSNTIETVSLAIVGHNPGLTELCNVLNLNGKWLDNLPTCGVVCFGFEADSWADIGPGRCELLTFDYPKLHFPKSTPVD